MHDLESRMQPAQHEWAHASMSPWAGRYLNERLNFEISITLATSEHNPPTAGLPPFVGLDISFGTVTDVKLGLWSFRPDTLCFCPTESQYQAFGMSYMAHWAHYLIHLGQDENTRQPLGLWWQFDVAKDGIWFRKLDR